MEIREVRDTLAPLGLKPPELEMLRPTEASYVCMLLQPSGPAVAGPKRIGGLDQNLNDQKTSSFLALAKERGANLAVAPEYFVPWSTLRALILAGTVPGHGDLWVLGCESVRAAELSLLRADLEESCEVIYEPCEVLAANRELLDPVVLLFTTERQHGGSRLVALIQFKTLPSRDPLFEEERLLRRGTAVYRFRGACGTLSAAALICSDAFALGEELVKGLVDRSTLVHIQLNPDPRNSAYRQYRKTTFELDPKASDCHILCLNWARTVVLHDEKGNTDTWPSVGASTWYCQNDACSHADAVVLPNHNLGIYYAYMRERRHALLLDYDEAVFELRVPKVLTTGKAVLANRNGPNSLARYVWAAATSQWAPQDKPPTSDYEQLLNGHADAKAALAHLGAASALDVERLLALSAGAISSSDNWYVLKDIDSFVIDADEVVRRITVPQDSSIGAIEFRHARLSVVANIRRELDVRPSWPPQIEGMNKDAQIRWNSANRHFNVYSSDGRPSLVCFLGDSPSRQKLENIPSMLIDLLRRAGGPHQKRMVVFYRLYGELKFADLPSLTKFDDALEDERDIASADPDRFTESP